MRSSTPLPPFLAHRAACRRYDIQHSELAAQGVTQGELRRWIRVGLVSRVARGSYLLHAPLLGSDDFARAREQYLRRCFAHLRAVPRAYLVRESALLALELPLMRIPDAVHVSIRPYARHERPGRKVHRPWPHSSAQEISGLHCQPTAEGVVEMSAHLGAENGLIAADAALHRGQVTPEELHDAVGRFGRRAGVGFARRVVALADGRVESPGETRLRWCAMNVGFALTPQVEIRDERGSFVARVDFVVAGTRVVVEFDGLQKYSSPEVLRAEKLRQMKIERLGYVVVRFRWSDLDQPGRVASMLQQAVATDRRVNG